MTRLNLLLTSIGLITLLACGGNSETKVVRDTATLSRSVDSLQPAKAEKDKTNKDTLTAGNDTTTMSLLLGNFKKVPDEIEGCGCYFSQDKDKFKRSEYLFVASYDSVAFISFDKKLVRLKMVSTTREPETFGDSDHIEVYASDQYKVTVDIKYKKSSGEETWQNNGTITIESKDGQKAVRKFFGECGC